MSTYSINSDITVHFIYCIEKNIGQIELTMFIQKFDIHNLDISQWNWYIENKQIMLLSVINNNFNTYEYIWSNSSRYLWTNLWLVRELWPDIYHSDKRSETLPRPLHGKLIYAMKGGMLSISTVWEWTCICAYMHVCACIPAWIADGMPGCLHACAEVRGVWISNCKFT